MKKDQFKLTVFSLFFLPGFLALVQCNNNCSQSFNCSLDEDTSEDPASLTFGQYKERISRNTETNCKEHQCSETDRCHYTTKGVIGYKHNTCHTTNDFHSDPAHESCFYNLTEIKNKCHINVTAVHGRNITQINFKYSPHKRDSDTYFSIYCSESAQMNITIQRVGEPDEQIVSNCSSVSYERRFSKNRYIFGVIDNVTQTTFYVHVYDFQAPISIHVDFWQYLNLINLIIFFVIISLLLTATFSWKIRQKSRCSRKRYTQYPQEI